MKTITCGLLQLLAIATAALSIRAQTPLEHVLGDEPQAGFGISVCPAGDVDGDGVGDLAVGSTLADGVVPDTGSVRMLSGADSSLLWREFGDTTDDQFGYEIGVTGDLDLDGVRELIVGAPFSDVGAINGGAAYVLSGATGARLFALYGESPNENFGFAVGGLDDLNGDGIPDFAVGGPTAQPSPGDHYGRVLLVSGASGDPFDELVGSESFGGYGTAVARTDDVDGDGIDDLIVGASKEDKGGLDSGAAHVYSGADRAALFTIAVATTNAAYGRSLARSRDVDGDGIDDLIIGAMYDPSSGTDSGSAYVHSGADGDLIFSLPRQQFRRQVRTARGRDGGCDRRWRRGLPRVRCSRRRQRYELRTCLPVQWFLRRPRTHVRGDSRECLLRYRRSPHRGRELGRR